MLKTEQKLGNPYDIIPIKKIYDEFLNELKPVFKDSPFGLPKKIYKAEQEEIY